MTKLFHIFSAFNRFRNKTNFCFCISTFTILSVKTFVFFLLLRCSHCFRTYISTLLTKVLIVTLSCSQLIKRIRNRMNPLFLKILLFSLCLDKVFVHYYHVIFTKYTLIFRFTIRLRILSHIRDLLSTFSELC